MRLNLPELAAGSWDPKLCHSFKSRSPLCKDRMLLSSSLFAQPPFLVMKSLYSDSGGLPPAPFRAYNALPNQNPALFYEWFMEPPRTLRLSTFSLFQTLVQWARYFSCQWEPERPDGLFWQDSSPLEGAPSRLRSKRKHKYPCALTSTGSCGKKYFDLILQLSFLLAQCECSASNQKCTCFICIICSVPIQLLGRIDVRRRTTRKPKKQPPH